MTTDPQPDPLDTHGMTMDGAPAMPILVAEYNALITRVNEAEGQLAVPPAPADRAAEAERRARYTAAIDEGFRTSDADTTEDAYLIEHLVDGVLALADAEHAGLRRERDLAIAHDRQPYPTAWAYEQACAALHRKTEAIERVLEWVAGLDVVARQVGGPDTRHPVADHIRHLLETPADAVLSVLPAPVDRAAVLREAADAVWAMDYDEHANDYGYDSIRDAWDGGTMDAAKYLRRLADGEADRG